MKDNTLEWQYKLLPLMIKIVIGTAIFFFLSTILQMYFIHSRIANQPVISEELILNMPGDVNTKILCILEKELIERRYHQANTSLMNRIWIKYLGFVTGMILSFIGAVFILGKLKVSETKINLDYQNVKLGLISSSPGIILVTFGTILMLVTILSHNPINVKDVPVFLNGSQSGQLILKPGIGQGNPADVEDLGSATKKDTTSRRP